MAPARIRSDLDAVTSGRPVLVDDLHRATGEPTAALDVTPIEALVRLRACAIGHSMPVSQAAYALLDRRLLAAPDGEWTWVPGRGSA